ncbi:hypothetical protein [Sphingomonas nostoxanthinifaciens]|uniref:hypothetical protein n=1 Tax=Sphingomonas nostoxanthinifaciens TaxID=2872652 RepID=UPI001CC219FB|nr:hypothetical protein [Sphingomonas nostoxanthinifaciens]UAK23695.1 hypothetical protein K8P63_15085 [Sphingomonas nostoxanthinifaciens]
MTEPTMIERVARAMEPSVWKDFTVKPGSDQMVGTMRREWETRRRLSLRKAERVIAAMRHPTDLMGNGLPNGYKPGSHSATQIWRAMIDAALAEGAR